MTALGTSRTTRFVPPNTPALEDVGAEQVRRVHGDKIVEIQQTPVLAAQVIKDVVLPDGVDVAIAHSLGRAPLFVTTSCIRGSGFVAGVVRDRGVKDGSGQPVDRTRFIVLQGVLFTTSVTVDVMVF